VDIYKDSERPGVVRIIGDAPGPRLVLFAGVHGDEVSGIHAIEKLFFDLFVGERRLVRGNLTLVRANSIAIAAERRYIKHNLNRLFRQDYSPDIDRRCYEFQRAQELKPILEECDYFLDLHSAPIAQEPFLVAEREAVAAFTGLGIHRIMTGWGKFAKGPIGGDAENYADRHGAKAATLESGSHFDKNSNDVAYRTIITLLSLLGLIETESSAAADEVEIVDVYQVVTKEAEDFRYAGKVQNFQFFEKGQAFAFQNNQSITVCEDSFLLIPMRPDETKLHEEVCYLGRRVDASP
jgi:succinylglutamate desuccinylase